MPLEQLDIFEMELSASESLFKRFNIEPKYGGKYSLRAKEATISGLQRWNNVVISGNLIKYDDNSVALSDVWMVSDRQAEDDKMGEYAEFAEVNLSQIQKIETIDPFHFSATIGAPYRIEMYKDATKTKETVWMSCFYRGVTINGKILLVDFGNANKIILCNKTEVKGFYPLSLEVAEK